MESPYLPTGKGTPEKRPLSVSKSVHFSPFHIRSYNACFIFGFCFISVSVEWGQGLCGERLPDYRDFSSAIASDGATTRQLGAPRGSEVETQEPESLETTTISSSSANSTDQAQLSPLPSFLRGAQLRLTSVACGSGHVLAAVSGGGVISWGGGALESSDQLGEHRVREAGRAIRIFR